MDILFYDAGLADCLSSQKNDFDFGFACDSAADRVIHDFKL